MRSAAAILVRTAALAVVCEAVSSDSPAPASFVYAPAYYLKVLIQMTYLEIAGERAFYGDPQ
jgi:hypothetical protein